MLYDGQYMRLIIIEIQECDGAEKHCARQMHQPGNFSLFHQFSSFFFNTTAERAGR